MGFENFGTVSFTTEAKTGEFLTYLEQGKFMTTRCKKCGVAHFPPKMDCPSCLESDTEWFQLPEKGTLVTYSTVHYGPSGFEDKAPYTLAVADFGNVRVFGQISRSMPLDDIRPGMTVKISPVKDGEKISYEFRSM